jgi:hypothetical protein
LYCLGKKEEIEELSIDLRSKNLDGIDSALQMLRWIVEDEILENKFEVSARIFEMVKTVKRTKKKSFFYVGETLDSINKLEHNK